MASIRDPEGLAAVEGPLVSFVLAEREGRGALQEACFSINHWQLRTELSYEC